MPDHHPSRIQTRFLAPQRAALAIRAHGEGDAAQPVIRGYGAVFYDESDPAGTQYDLFGDGEYLERIMPGAFDRALEEDDVRSLFNHDANIVLGRNTAGTLTLSVDATGLLYEATPPATQLIRDQVVAPIERGDVDGSSFMFVVRTTAWREEQDVLIREIEEVELWETGPVTFPAYESTTSQIRANARAALAAEIEDYRRARRQTGCAATRRRVNADFRLAEVTLRNAPCACGSGRKWKRCHGETDE